MMEAPTRGSGRLHRPPAKGGLRSETNESKNTLSAKESFRDPKVQSERDARSQTTSDISSDPSLVSFPLEDFDLSTSQNLAFASVYPEPTYDASGSLTLLRRPVKMAPAQSFVSSYAPRMKLYANSLITPVIPPANTLPPSRTTKRGTIAINYADDAYDDDDFEDSESNRRPTGLRSLRREDTEKKEPTGPKIGKEVHMPVEVQPIFRDWMVRRTVKPSTAQQVHVPVQLPLTLIPIRIDLDVPAHQPDPPFPLPRNHLELGINATNPAYRRPDPLPAYKVRDFFLWNLHEALMTPDDMALQFVRDLDLPNPAGLAMQYSSQIRTQLEEYAGIALHPLFINQTKTTMNGAANPTPAQNGTSQNTPREFSAAPTTPAPSVTIPFPENSSLTATATAPILSGQTPGPAASPQPPVSQPTPSTKPLKQIDPALNPDDAYRCIVNLSVNLGSVLYTDKFEWSLLHPPGYPEAFAKQTCADMGLGGEWVSAMTHAIYEAVLRLKKEAIESGGLLGAEIDNQAVSTGMENGPEFASGAGWRYDNEDLGKEWEPTIERLSKEEIEKREGDRERQLRRLRRETARFSSAAGVPGTTAGTQQERGGYFDTPDASETPMGRGERSKKKRRFRSLSPVDRALRTPGGGDRGTPDVGFGGGMGKLEDWERTQWRCSHCLVFGSAVWTVRDGPLGPRSLCHNCGLLYERDKRLPVWLKDLHRHDVPIGR